MCILLVIKGADIGMVIVQDYRIVKAGTNEKLSEDVSKFLAEDYERHGDLVVCCGDHIDGIVYCQAVIKHSITGIQA